MIVYTPFWNTLKRRGYTTYTLRKTFKSSGSTVHRLRNNMPLSTTTLNDFCELLHCSLSEIAEYVPDSLTGP